MFWSKLKWFLLFFLILDLGFLNFEIYKLLNLPIIPSSPIVTPIPTSIPTPTTVVATPSPGSLPTQPVIIQTKKNRSVSYLPIPGNGQSSGNNWENLPGTEFNFNTDDYPNLKDAYFEANFKLLNGNGLAYLRLFDVTAGIEVWGSEVKSPSQSFTMVVSGKLTLRTGDHLYRVQAKSLTADTAVYNFGRLKLISEN